MDEECEKFSNSKSSASGCCLVFAWFFAIFSLALLKVLLTKKACVIKKLFFVGIIQYLLQNTTNDFLKSDEDTAEWNSQKI